MVDRSPALDLLRDYIIASGSSFLHNVVWVSGSTCRTCAGIPRAGYSECYQCAQRSNRVGLADLLGFVTYGWNGAQAGRTMYAYKAGGETSYQLVSSLVAYAVVAHWNCIVRNAGSHPDGWATVPSLAGRVGQHPLEHITAQVMGQVPQVVLSPNPAADDPRSFNPSHFIVAPTTARHVLLIEDTWTTGGHLQSASAALKAAGISRVTGLTIARWLDPSWADTTTLIATLTRGFDPDVCPYTGTAC